MDPPVDGQEVGDCAVYLWATKGSRMVFKLGIGSKWQLLEKRFNGRVPYGTTRLCFFVDQINREERRCENEAKEHERIQRKSMMSMKIIKNH